jgi:hypothetical protein
MVPGQQVLVVSKMQVKSKFATQKINYKKWPNMVLVHCTSGTPSNWPKKYNNNTNMVLVNNYLWYIFKMKVANKGRIGYLLTSVVQVKIKVQFSQQSQSNVSLGTGTFKNEGNVLAR